MRKRCNTSGGLPSSSQGEPPFVGYYYYDFLPRVINYVPRFDTEEERLKWEYLLPERFIARARSPGQRG
ncbi:hypothetical protein [Thermococcus sp.]|uniref:hypothetical protein n=1 Tax=Thermococcus sp. TaxID=35749 RepID=UPI002632C3D9|nr:hypothetical protein [Thermococcus sp.]